MDRNKKIFIFILVALAAIATAFLIYYFFFSANTGPVTPPTAPPTTIPTTPGGGAPVTPPAVTPPSGGILPGVFKPILRQITTVPTAGGIVFDKNGKPTVRYIERAKGNVYETDAASIKAIRQSNTTIPQIYEAFWNKSGSGVIARFLKEGDNIQTFDAIVVPGTGGQGELRGEFLSANIKNLVVSPSGNQIFYLVEVPSGLVGIAASFDGGKKVQVFDSPLREWVADWPKENTVTVTSKAGAGSDGLLIFINTGTGKSDVILAGLKGLTTLTNSDASKVLYSVSSQNSLRTSLFSVADKSSAFFPLAALPEKCVWSQLQKNTIYCTVPETLPSANYPDDWYQGTVSFRDELWKIDTATGNSQFIMNLGDQSRTDFDAINLSLNSKENYLLLTNKNDLTLWEVQLAP
jgi:hypothetical protein